MVNPPMRKVFDKDDYFTNDFFVLQKSRKIFTPCIIILKDVTLQSFVCVPQQKMFLVVDCCLLYLLLT